VTRKTLYNIAKVILKLFESYAGILAGSQNSGRRKQLMLGMTL